MPVRFSHLSIMAICLLLAVPAYAQDTVNVTNGGSVTTGVTTTDAGTAAPPGVDVLPAMSLSTNQLSAINPDNPTHPTLEITPDKSEIVRLDADAASVIVGNPATISVLAENSKTLVIVPKTPGATYLAVLDNQGNVIMQRHVIVAKPQGKYIRIRKTCSPGDRSCQSTAVFYCPDMCHEINMNTGGGNGSDGGSGNNQQNGGSTANDTDVNVDTGAETGGDNSADGGSGEEEAPAGQ